ncbi:MAG: FliH/SctL family protein [Phycisphaerae bacterium]
MADPLTINLTKPVKSAKIIDDYNDARCQILDTRQESRIENQESKNKAEIAQLCQTLNGLVGELNRFYEQVLAKHKEEIAKLSVEIAKKVLIQKVQKSDYQIESIVKEALKNAPARQQVLVHLNPQDLSACQKLQQDDPDSAFAEIKFIADPSIGRAECLLETPKGIIKSFIEQHLERISEALAKVE